MVRALMKEVKRNLRVIVFQKSGSIESVLADSTTREHDSRVMDVLNIESLAAHGFFQDELPSQKTQQQFKSEKLILARQESLVKPNRLNFVDTI